MKTKILIFMLAIATGMSGQISLEHSFVNNDNIEKGSYVFYINNTAHFFTTNQTNMSINIYDNNYDLEHTINISAPTGYDIIKNIFLMSDHLFDTDNGIEFIVLLNNSTTYEKKLLLIDDNGSIVIDFGDKLFSYLIYSNPDYKLVINHQNGYDVYSLPGSLSVQQQTIYNRSIVTFPVPTNGQLHIRNALGDGEGSVLYIYNLAGQMLMQKEVEGSNINVDVSGLPSGNYIYKIGGYTGYFIKK